jgi:hypothetical protein
MTTIKLIRELTNKELQSCFKELTEWMKSGVLKEDSMVRAIHEYCEVKMDMEFDLRRIEHEILCVIGERFSEIDFNK